MHYYITEFNYKIFIFQWYSFVTDYKEIITMILKEKAALSF